MTGRTFNKISPALWSSARFLGLTDKGKLAFIYFCTNSHVTSAGCYVLPDGYACTDLRCGLESYQAMRTEVLEAGMIDFDPDHNVIFIEKWFKHNPPTNVKHAMGTYKLISNIPSERLRQKTLDEIVPVEEARIGKLEQENAAKEERMLQRKMNDRTAIASDSRLASTNYIRGNR